MNRAEIRDALIDAIKEEGFQRGMSADDLLTVRFGEVLRSCLSRHDPNLIKTEGAKFLTRIAREIVDEFLNKKVLPA